ncbi:MAG: shikimate kinase [Pseudobdellovibrionaceae bacterium]
MIQIIIGHRGVGKSSLGRRMQIYFPEKTVLDLDVEISKAENKEITEIFKQDGEASFRKLEQKHFKKIYTDLVKKMNDAVITVGGGFEVENLPKEVEVIFLQRNTDMDGRIFLDRVRLNDQVTPLEEFLQRYEPRQKRFEKAYDFCYQVPEGMTEYFLELQKSEKTVNQSLVIEIEKLILTKNFQTAFGYTVQTEDIQNAKRFEQLKNLVLADKIGFLEARDDLLTKTQIFELLRQIPQGKILLSFRQLNSLALAEQVVLLPGIQLWGVDCEQEFFEDTFINLFESTAKKFISSHGDHIPQILPTRGWEIKWSPLVSSWKELRRAMQWKFENPKICLFPRSVDGRWYWVRLLLSRYQKLNFLCLGRQSAVDQPTLFDCLLYAKLQVHGIMAGVMGFPIHHSFSSLYHADYFAKKNIPYFRLSINESEWSEAWSFFEVFKDRFDLQLASVTSPLKQLAAKFSDNQTNLNSCNTVMQEPKEQKFSGFNTDEPAFVKAFGKDLQNHILMWGGGAMIEVIKSACETAGALSFTQMSSRQMDFKNFDFEKNYVLVWAAPLSDQTLYPHKDIKIEKILDLNYFENSFGRNLALARKIPYESGYEMFRLQALHQQKIWSQS